MYITIQSKLCILILTFTKLQVVKEALEVGNKALVARRYELSPNLVQRWVKAYEEGQLGQEIVFSPSSAEIKRLEEENEQLKKLLGEKI